MMHQRVDPVRASNRIAGSYRDYLRTTFAPADPAMRDDLSAAVSDRNLLVRGPMLEATPPYTPGSDLGSLVDEGVVHPAMLELDSEVFPPSRPLHVHQEQALRRITDGGNTVVATGTGSGKTEAFLLPILDALLRERDDGTVSLPGVRALLLYPMNALANDQMKRLRDLFAPFPELTFGQYVGATEQTEQAAHRKYLSQMRREPPANELISRDAMTARPPHVLLTNFAMLEYLLLRPADSPFFDGEHAHRWRFVVLDEVHVYDGSKGAELGMLLRRVRDRVHRSERDRFRCVATSATLGSGGTEPLVDFAERLFDEDFGEGSVITPTRLPLRQAERAWKMAPSAAVELRDLLDTGADTAALASWIRRYWPDAPDPGEGAVEAYLHRVLSCESSVIDIQDRLEDGSVDLGTAAAEVLGDPQRQDELVALVDLGLAARSSPTSAPLLPARYHLMLRALEGGFACLSPGHPATEPRLGLTRAESCAACASTGTESSVFEIGVCRSCNATYAVGDRDEAIDGTVHVTEARVGPPPGLYLLFDREALERDDEDEQVVADEVTDERVDERSLCTSCGSLTERGSMLGCGCGHSASVPVVVAHPSADGEPLRRCAGCGARSNREIVLRLMTGTDAPVGVLATELYQELPPSQEDDKRIMVGEGRKLLSFADSRQAAAYFAPFLSTTYGRNVQRRLILDAVADAEPDDPYRLEDLVRPVRRAAERCLVLDPDASGRANSAEVTRWLVREALGVDRRQSLDGIGLVEVSVGVPDSVRRMGAPQALTALGLGEDEAFDLVRVLLGSLVSSAALYLPEGVEMDDPAFDPIRRATRVRLLGSQQPRILSWLPSAGTNRRIDYVTRILNRLGNGTDPRELLEGLWSNWLTSPGSGWHRVLPDTEDARGGGTVHAVSSEWIEFLAAGEGHQPVRCDRCGQMAWRSVAAVCPRLGCTGTLVETHDQADTYYASLYRRVEPNAMRVEEHTGQLSSDWARELQQRFLDGEVNTLSCSTTFELGVDVGEVQGVLLRNMPPTPANYVQRAGRAGRRAGAAALVVTFAQRRSHDRYFFDRPELMVDGHVTSPVVSLANETIVRRHLHAIAYADFVRRCADAGDEWASQRSVTVERFFSPGTDPTPAGRFREWLGSRPEGVTDAVRRVCPPEAAEAVEAEDDGWVERLLDTDADSDAGWYTRAEQEVVRDLSDLDERLEAAYETRESAGRIGYLTAVRHTVGGRRLIDFLAQRKVLPKYGFPVDVVDLDVSRSEDPRAGRVELQRDLRLGIVDFAPGNSTVAVGAFWQSEGLRKPPGRAFIRYDWRSCDDCGAFSQRPRHGDEGLRQCPRCESPSAHRQGSFVQPAFGFLGTFVSDAAGRSRPARSGYPESYFGDYAGGEPEPQLVLVGSRHVEVRSSRQGQITVVNAGGGRGYRLCFSCGRLELPPAREGRDRERRPHPRPDRAGRSCEQPLVWTQLGHFFQTDVVELDLGISRDEPAITQSVLAALVAGASALGISGDDIDGTVRYSNGRPTLVIYDTVPGGAGHALRLAGQVPELIGAALDIVSDCDCAEDSSCYGCLRRYGNQLQHDELSRSSAVEGLSGVGR